MEKRYKPYEIDVNSLGFYIDRLLYALIKRRNEDLKETGSDLLHAEFIVLKILNIIKGASQTQLANVLGKERSGVSRLLASLEKKGYIRREALNGSTNYVTLTEKGEQFIPTVSELSEKLNDRAFRGFSEKSRFALLNNLHRIYYNITSEDK